ncbi:MAG: HD domain-containing phosphohydrolase [Phycisphaeraceae bacterium]
MPLAFSHRWLIISGLLALQLLCLVVSVSLLDAWAGEALQRASQPVAESAQAQSQIDASLARLRSGAMIAAGVVLLITCTLVFWFVRSSERTLQARGEALQRTLESQFNRRTRDLERGRDAVAFGLARLAESRDDQTGDHLERISLYTEALVRHLERTRTDLRIDDVEMIIRTAPLHDIGKVGIPDAVLLKPGPLTDDEREIIQRHPYIGGDTLVEMKRRWGDDDFLDTACEIIFGHHERWDGTGYPFGLKGQNIPLSARIVAVADVYDALTTARPYKSAMTHEKASAILREGSGSHFDPEVITAFEQIAEEFREIARKHQDPPSEAQEQPAAG